MSVARAREVMARLRAAGVTVHEWPGWESRGNGLTSNYEGLIVHHTASGYGSAFPVLVNGRPDLDGPLCNTSGNADGSVTMVAAHPANHAGAGNGRSMGPLPRAGLFNPRVWGHEIVYPGDRPMTDAQARTARILARICVDVFGYGDIERSRAHAETSVEGKWDPGYAPGRTIDMTVFRREAAAILEDELANSDEILAGINNILNCLMFGGDSTRQTGKDGPAQGIDGSSLLGRTNDIQWALTNALPTLMGAVKSGVKVDPEAFRALISGAVNDAVGPAVRDAIGDENAEKVNEIAEAVKSKLATALAGGAA